MSKKSKLIFVYAIGIIIGLLYVISSINKTYTFDSLLLNRNNTKITSCTIDIYFSDGSSITYPLDLMSHSYTQLIHTLQTTQYKKTLGSILGDHASSFPIKSGPFFRLFFTYSNDVQQEFILNGQYLLVGFPRSSDGLSAYLISDNITLMRNLQHLFLS